MIVQSNKFNKLHSEVMFESEEKVVYPKVMTEKSRLNEKDGFAMD